MLYDAVGCCMMSWAGAAQLQTFGSVLRSRGVSDLSAFNIVRPEMDYKRRLGFCEVYSWLDNIVVQDDYRRTRRVPQIQE